MMTKEEETASFKSTTTGTLAYKISLKSKYSLKQEFPLELTEFWDGSYCIYCPAFDEYGYGKSYHSALSDLGSSIVDFWLSLRKLVKRKRNLGNNLRRILSLMEENIDNGD